MKNEPSISKENTGPLRSLSEEQDGIARGRTGLNTSEKLALRPHWSQWVATSSWWASGSAAEQRVWEVYQD